MAFFETVQSGGTQNAYYYTIAYNKSTSKFTSSKGSTVSLPAAGASVSLDNLVTITYKGSGKIEIARYDDTWVSFLLATNISGAYNRYITYTSGNSFLDGSPTMHIVFLQV